MSSGPGRLVVNPKEPSNSDIEDRWWRHAAEQLRAGDPRIMMRALRAPYWDNPSPEAQEALADFLDGKIEKRNGRLPTLSVNDVAALRSMVAQARKRRAAMHKRLVYSGEFNREDEITAKVAEWYQKELEAIRNWAGPTVSRRTLERITKGLDSDD